MPTIDHETNVRQAASTLRRAITDANTAGLHVAWPRNPEGLDLLAISLTGRAPAEPKLGAKAINAADLTLTGAGGTMADSKTVIATGAKG